MPAGRPALTITDREKAAIYFHLFGGENDWGKLYLISRPGEMAKHPEDIKYLRDLSSKWKNSPKIKDFLQEVNDRLTYDRMREEERIKAKAQEDRTPAAESDRTANKEKTPKVDYYDPAEQRKQINRIIQEASDDPKTQLDAIKAIQQTQRDDRQAARDQKQVQCFLPLRCNSCPLMEKARKRLPE